jgi:hypothetical protein
VPTSQPKRPHSYPEDALPCDPELPLRALAYRIEHQLTSAKAFSAYNVNVWLLKNKDKVEYVVAHNETIAEGEKRSPRDPENPTRVGLHSEGLIAGQLSTRLDVLRSETVVQQIFTERMPCSECRILLTSIPYLRNVPRYFYLLYHDKDWQKARANGSWGVYLMACYRISAT